MNLKHRLAADNTADEILSQILASRCCLILSENVASEENVKLKWENIPENTKLFDAETEQHVVCNRCKSFQKR